MTGVYGHLPILYGETPKHAALPSGKAIEDLISHRTLQSSKKIRNQPEIIADMRPWMAMATRFIQHFIPIESRSSWTVSSTPRTQSSALPSLTAVVIHNDAVCHVVQEHILNQGPDTGASESEMPPSFQLLIAGKK